MKSIAAREEKAERGGRGEALRDAEGEPRNVTTDADAWPLVPLKEVCIPRTGVRNPADRPDEKFRYVDISAVDNERKRISDPQTLLGRDAPSRARNIIRTRDVVVATTRPNLNAVALVPDDLDDQICSTGFCVLRAGPRIVPEYLFAFVRSPAFVDPLTELVKGALYPAVNDGQVLALSIPLPPLAEQERIAGRLTEQLAAAERARGAAQSRLAAAESLPAAYLREVFEGPEANEWEHTTLDDLCTIVRGSSPRPRGDSRYYGGSVPRLMVEDCTRDGMFVTPRIDFLTDEGAKLSRPMKAGDVVMVVSGNPGLPAILAVDSCIHDGFVGLRAVSDRVDRSFLYHYLHFHRRRTDVNATGAIFRNLTTTQVGNVPVHLPPLPGQRRIAADLAARLAGAERLAEGIRAELAAIEALTAALMREAFGEREAVPNKSVELAPQCVRGATQPGDPARRAAVGAYIVHRLSMKPQFGRVHFEKNLYLTEAFVGFNIAGCYERRAAGPLDIEALDQIESFAADRCWFTKHPRDGTGWVYRVGAEIGVGVAAAQSMMGDLKGRMDAMLDLTARMDTQKVEMVATLFAVWNDRLVGGAPVDDALLIEDVREHWHYSKQRFTPAQLSITLNEMRSSGLTPTGIGPRTRVVTAAPRSTQLSLELGPRRRRAGD